MQGDARRTEAGRRYAMAYEAHYTTKDLGEAFDLYRDVMAAHPDTPEAGYAHAQVENIVRSVVPRQALLDAHLELALTHLPHPGSA